MQKQKFKFIIIYFILTFAVFGAREDYGGWAKNITGCNTRQQILKDNAVFVLHNVSKCEIMGLWIDFYTGQVLKHWQNIDIDHVLPVSFYEKHCKMHNTSFEQLKIFYNDKDNLVITSRQENRRKGSKTKEQYKQIIQNEERRVEYEKKYDLIYDKYCKN